MSCGSCGEDSKFEGKLVGKVTHFFGNISVAVIEPEDKIKIGDTVKIYDKEGNVILEQAISSMQIDRKEIQEATKGMAFGMKVDGEVKDGYLVYKQE